MTEKKNLYRRDFLKLAGTSAAAVTAAGALQGYVVPTVPPTTVPAEALPPEAAEPVTLTRRIDIHVRIDFSKLDIQSLIETAMLALRQG